MTPRSLFQAAAVALVVGSAVFGVAMIVESPSSTYGSLDTFSSVRWRSQEVALLVSMPLLLLGITGLFVREAGALGVVGFVGYVLTTIGAAAFLGMGAITAFAIPVVATSADAAKLLAMDGPFFAGVFPGLAGGGGAAFALGWILLCVAAYRGRVSSRWAWVSATAGAILAAAPPMAGAWIHPTAGLLFGAAGIALGGSLWSSVKR